MTQFDNTEIAFRYRSDKDLRLGRYLFNFIKSPLITRMGIAATEFSIKAHLPVKGLIKKTLFKQFCGGENMSEAAKTAEVIGKYRVDTILDYGVEGKEDEDEFDKATNEFIKAINFAASQKNIPFVSLKVTGFARFALLEKINSHESLSENERLEWQRANDRVERVCNAAYQKKIMILIDAEETWILEPVNDLTEKMMEKFNKERAYIFNTYQLYSHGTLQFLEESIEKAVSLGYILGAKLVRGAYMEKGYADPIQPNKESTDRDYDDAVKFCLQNLNKLALFIGTHNEKSCLDAAKYMQQQGIKPGNQNVFFSQLYGMGDNISFNLADEGYHVSKYLPYGPVYDVIPYLMRRAQENTSVAGATTRELELINKEIRRRDGVRHQ
jgi:proline dehydrogenase